MASAVLSTLGHVTERKLDKLAEQQKKFGAQRNSILQAVEKESDAAEKVVALIDGFNQHGIQTDRLSVSIQNIKRFIDQSRVDPSVSQSLLKDWQAQLEHTLEIEGLRYDFAALFGRLVTEWIKNPNVATAASPGSDAGDSSSDNGSSASFEEVGREEMHQQRKEWESYVFTERKTHEEAINKYLHGLFDSTLKSKKIQKTPLQVLQKTIRNFKFDMEFDTSSLKWCISGLLKSDLFSGKKREALVDLQSRPTVLKEMADVLNMDLASLDTWEWSPSPVPLNMRRQLNGKYRAYMDEEIHQALLLQFIGTHWAVHLKQAFTTFYHSGAWIQSPFVSMSKKSKARRNYFLGAAATPRDSVRNARRREYQENYFMTQLPQSVEEGSRDYNEDAEDGDEDMGSTAGETKAPISIKQSMLRLATTEMHINTKIYGEFAILQSDFKWFGPSLPHSTIFTVLKFFGVQDKWLGFFKKFLTSPLVFAQDGPGADPQTRKCGIPMSHVLSDALGEAVLFCLDFAVNQRTNGANLYRFHDDLWFWGQESVCIEAWKAMKEFSSIMGLELNEEKTGAALTFEDPKKARPLSPSLPKGQIHWGFLNLNATEGRWKIDPGKVDEHIEELRRQLAACRSVFALVQAWKSYNRFFAANFGQPAKCFGREHIDMVIDTYKHIQHKLFAGSLGVGGSVTEHLRGLIHERFGVDRIPDGFFYFPVELGGLDLGNPFIQPLAVRKRATRTPTERIELAFEYEEEEYETAKKKFDDGAYIARSSDNTYTPKPDEPFMSLEEFVKFREETSSPLYRAYKNLMETYSEDEVEATPEVKGALKALPSDDWGKSGFKNDWSKLNPYWKWILQLYAGDMVQRFGGLSMGERGLLPIGLFSMLKSEKVRWQG